VHEAARFLPAGCRFVLPRGSEAVQLDHTPVLAIPGAPAAREPTVRALLEYVERGGHLLIVAESLVLDERGREADHLLRFGIEVKDTQRPTYSTRARPERGGALDDLVVSELPKGAIIPVKDGPLGPVARRMPVHGPRQAIHINVRHEVLAGFDDGGEAIVRFPRGKGVVTYLAAPLQPRDLRPVLAEVAAHAGVEAPVQVRDARGRPLWGIECFAAPQDKRTLLALWNTTAQTEELVIEAPAAKAARILSSGTPLPVGGEDGTRIGPLPLGPWETALLEILPE
jgi:hypothetical protein